MAAEVGKIRRAKNAKKCMSVGGKFTVKAGGKSQGFTVKKTGLTQAGAAAAAKTLRKTNKQARAKKTACGYVVGVRGGKPKK
jgi:hypothetical protein